MGAHRQVDWLHGGYLSPVSLRAASDWLFIINGVESLVNEVEPRPEAGSRTNAALVCGGEEEDRTPDLRIANATLSQLSYPPNSFNFTWKAVGVANEVVGWV